MKKMLAMLLALCLALLTACGSETVKTSVGKNKAEPERLTITVDKNGMASWQAAAPAYAYMIVDKNYTNMGEQLTENTFVQLPEGFSVHVYPVHADGSKGDIATSDYFGEPAAWEDFTHEQLIAMGLVQETEEQPQETVEENPEYAAQEYIPFAATMDENGCVSWEPVRDAVAYEVVYLYGGTRYDDGFQIGETSVRLPEHYSAEICPVYADGTRGYTAVSDTYGEEVDPGARHLTDFSAFSSYDMIAGLDRESFAVDENGTVTFASAGPDGQPMRFEATGVTLAEDGLVVAPWAKVTALDALGRIMGVRAFFADIGSRDNGFAFIGEYAFDGAHSVENASQLVSGNGLSIHAWAYDEGSSVDLSSVQPNYISFSTNYNDCDLTLSSLTVYYDPSEKTTPIRNIGLSAMDHGSYLEGEKYDPAKEELYDPYNGVFTFMLCVELDTPGSWLGETSVDCIRGVPNTFYTVGDLKDAQGNVLDKNNAVVEEGTVLEVTIGSYTCDVEVPMVKRYTNAQTMHDLVPEVYPETTGELVTLVVPIAWQDEQHTYDDETMLSFKAELGRVEDESGAVTDYSAQLSDESRWSLSEYYDQASYGKMNIRSFVTQWYPAPYTYEEMRHAAPSDEFLKTVTEWLYVTYPNMDWGRFDRDANGCFDSVIFLNAGGRDKQYDSFTIISFGGGVNTFRYYTTEGAGSAFRPAINQYILLHENRFADNTLVHEFGHTLGLVDYYDVTYSGGNAVGGYDMQSDNRGDWNAYSKYAAGWIDPVVVKGLAQGESVEVTIGSMALTGDAIVIPAAQDEQDGTPFNEYVLIDLFTDDGLHEYSAKEYGLEGAAGVRIYHVNATMERRELTYDTAFGEVFPIGTVKYTNVVNPDGRYLIELVQRGGDNTFTDLADPRAEVNASDLFRAGDLFTVEDYAEFFLGGLMDSGLPFGYTVEIVSVDAQAAQATIRITRN